MSSASAVAVIKEEPPKKKGKIYIYVRTEQHIRKMFPVPYKYKIDIKKLKEIL